MSSSSPARPAGSRPVTPHLPDLLEALAHVLARPGAFPHQVFCACQGAPWLPEAAAEPLRVLASTSPTELDIAYAGHFLVGRAHETLHLEEGAHRLGRLADPGLEADLRATYGVWGFTPIGPTEHLATQLEALVALLRALAEGAVAPEAGPLRAGLALLDGHTLPFLARLRIPELDGPYGAALLLGEILLREVQESLHGLLMGA